MSIQHMNVRILTGAPGCGKTKRIREEAIRTPGLYLYAAPTIELVKQQMADFRAETPTLDVLEVHSRSRGRGAVSKRLAEAKADLEAKGAVHAIILTTHEALLSPDLPDFSGWHIYVDEAINAVRSGTIKRSLADDLLAANFDLKRVGTTDWSELKPCGASPGWQALAQDDSAKSILEFLKLAFSESGVFVRTTSWETVRPLDWMFVWSPLSLPGAASLTLAGAASKSSIAFKVWKDSFANRLSFSEEVIAPFRPGSPSVRVHYFTETHDGSTTFWDTSVGRHCLHRVANHLTDNVPGLGFWSGNEAAWKYMEHRMPGTLILPKVMGINSYRRHNSCAMIYSSKPLPGDNPIQEIFGVTDDDLLAAREQEDIAQFVFRGAIRNRDFDGAYDIYVYSKRQAEQLQHRLVSDRVVANAQLVPVPEAGLMYVRRSGCQPPTSMAFSAQERQEKDRLRKEGERAAKAKLAGRVPGKRGRPPKSSNCDSQGRGAAPIP